MDTNTTQSEAKPPHDLDLSVPFTLYLDDVAKLLRISLAAARQRAYRGRIAVKPKPRTHKRAPFEWSSLDWHRYYHGKK